MNDKKYTDEQIVRALRSWISSHDCDIICTKESMNCDKCLVELLKQTFFLINRQKAEIETLKMDNGQLHSDIINATQNLDHITGLWENEREKVKNAKQKVINIAKALKTARAEAIKEFAERLKLQPKHYAVVFYGSGRQVTKMSPFVDNNDIDQLVKELTEGGQ